MPISIKPPAWRHLAFLAAILPASLAVLPAAQAAYPDRPITIVVPVPAGGPADALTRMIAQKLEARLGQKVVVENKPGAAGVLGSSIVAHSRPDGYTLVLPSSALVVIQAVKPKSMTFDLLKDLTPITQTAQAPMIFAANATAPFQDLRGMVAYAKANPGKLSVGVTPGPGGTAHLTLERMKLELGFDAVAVPYKGSTEAIMAVRSHGIPVMIDVLSASAPYIAEGTMRGLATLTEKRVNPNIPTVAEAGYPGYAANSWNGLMAPAGTPPEVIARLDKEVSAILGMPEIIAKTHEIGFVPPTPPAPGPSPA